MKKIFALLGVLFVMALPIAAQMPVSTVWANASIDQTSSTLQGSCSQAFFVQANNTGADYTGGTLALQESLDGSVWTATALSFSAAELNAGTVKKLTTCAPAVKLVFASLTFTYGKTQTTGSGLSDLTMSGTYTALVNHTYYIKISSTGTPDKFQWKKDTGAYSAEVSIVGGAIALADGVQVTFGATTGHTLGNEWTVTTPSTAVLVFAR